MDDVLVLIPAYNEQKTIVAVTEHCLQYVRQVLVIDDGSTDQTSALVKNTRAELHQHAVNQGKGATLLTGFQLAIQKNCRGVIAMDADGQHNPDDLPKFLALSEQYPDDLIIGARNLSAHQAPKGRRFANKIADFFISLAARKRLYDTQSGFRYYPLSFLKQYMASLEFPGRFAFEAEILVASVSSGLSVRYVDIVSCYPADARASHYRASKDTWEIAKVIARLIFKSQKSKGTRVH